MSKQAHLPDGTILEFPDDTPDAVMDGVVKQHLSQAPAANNSQFAQMISGKPAESSPIKDLKDRIRAAPGGAIIGSYADWLDAGQHHLMNLPHGLAQLIEHGLNYASGGAMQDTVNQDDAALRQREADYQARTPDGLASYAGAAGGEVAPWMTGIGELRAMGLLPKFAAATTLGGKAANVAGKAGLLAAEGGAMGATAPVTGQGSYADQKLSQVATGAIAAPVTAGAVKTVGAATPLLRYLTAGGRDAIANERLARMLGNDPATEAALRAPSPIPGYTPTPAQAISSPEAVQAERILRNNGQTAPAFAAQESANNAALRTHVAGIAGTDQAMTAAHNQRRAVEQAFRSQYLPETGGKLVDPAPVVGVLQKLSLSGNDTVRRAAIKHLGLIRANAAQNGGKISVTALDDIRQGVGSTLRSIPQHGAVTPQEVVKYEPVSAAITDTLERAIPGYRANLAAYARHSQPINDMEAGRALLSAIDSGGRDAGGNQNVSLAQVKALISKDNRANYPMSPQARQQIENVLEALQRRTVSHNTIAATGPGTAADVQRAVQASPLLMRMLGHGAAGVGGIFGGIPGYLAGAGAVEGANAFNNAVTRRVGVKAANSQLAADAIAANRLRLAKPRNMLLPLPYEQR